MDAGPMLLTLFLTAVISGTIGADMYMVSHADDAQLDTNIRNWMYGVGSGVLFLLAAWALWNTFNSLSGNPGAMSMPLLIPAGSRTIDTLAPSAVSPLASDVWLGSLGISAYARGWYGIFFVLLIVYATLMIIINAQLLNSTSNQPPEDASEGSVYSVIYSSIFLAAGVSFLLYFVYASIQYFRVVSSSYSTSPTYTTAGITELY